MINQGERTVELGHLFTETEAFANHCLKLWLMYQCCKPPIDILERLTKLWLQNLHIVVPKHITHL